MRHYSHTGDTRGDTPSDFCITTSLNSYGRAAQRQRQTTTTTTANDSTTT
eukprot:m.74 g.74  ORF g.74 m.74 type:complete len:50 (+) comp45_c0_seq1:26-175(+)